MSDHGIIFSAPMVLALLDGRKTQTRRLATSPLRRVVPGDRLWVRETCAAEELSDGTDGVCYLANDCWQAIDNSAEAAERWGRLFHYRKRPAGKRGETVPAIHMPRWASRLTLQVTDVRVHDLQFISNEDCVAEGVPSRLPDNGIAYAEYHDLWNSLHTEPGMRWEDNPRVLALTFTVEQRNIDR